MPDAAAPAARPPRSTARSTDVRVDAGIVAAIGPDLPAPAGRAGRRSRRPGPAARACGTRTCTSTSGRSPAAASTSGRPGPPPRRRRWSPPGCATDPPEPGTALVGHGFRDALWPDAPHRDLLDPSPAPSRSCWWPPTCTAAGSTRPPPPATAWRTIPTGLVRERDWMPIMTDVRSVPAAPARPVVPPTPGRAAAARGVVGIVDYEAPWQLDAWAARIAGGRRRAAGGGVGVARGARRLRTGRSPAGCAAATSCRAPAGC